jgi:hypothetical protein
MLNNLDFPLIPAAVKVQIGEITYLENIFFSRQIGIEHKMLKTIKWSGLSLLIFGFLGLISSYGTIFTLSYYLGWLFSFFSTTFSYGIDKRFLYIYLLMFLNYRLTLLTLIYCLYHLNRDRLLQTFYIERKKLE